MNEEKIDPYQQENRVCDELQAKEKAQPSPESNPSNVQSEMAINALEQVSGETLTYDEAFRKLEIVCGVLMAIRDCRLYRVDIYQATPEPVSEKTEIKFHEEWIKRGRQLRESHQAHALALNRIIVLEEQLFHARKEALMERDRFKLALETIESWDVGRETLEGVISRLKFIARQSLAEARNGHLNLTSELAKGTV